MHDEGVEVLGQTTSGRLVAGVLEVVDHDLEAELAVLDACGLVQHASVVEANTIVL